LTGMRHGISRSKSISLMSASLCEVTVHTPALSSRVKASNSQWSPEPRPLAAAPPLGSPYRTQSGKQHAGYVDRCCTRRDATEEMPCASKWNGRNPYGSPSPVHNCVVGVFMGFLFRGLFFFFLSFSHGKSLVATGFDTLLSRNEATPWPCNTVRFELLS